MIYDYRNLKDQKIKVDVCIVGTGAGGMALAASLSKAGFRE